MEGIRRYLFAAIDRIEIIGQAAIIHKKREIDPSVELRANRAHVESAKDWSNWLAFSEKLKLAGADEAEITDALKRSIELNMLPLVSYHRLSEALERARDFTAAIETLDKAIKYARTDAATLADLDVRINRLRDTFKIAN